MFILDASRSQPGNQVYSLWVRWHRLAGYVLSPHVFTAAESLFSTPKASAEVERPSVENVHLATSLLRQALVFQPFNQRLLAHVQRLHAVVPASPSFDLWLKALQRLRRVRPDCFTEWTALTFPMHAKESAAILKEQREGQNPAVFYIAIDELWSRGQWEAVREMFVRMMALPMAPFLAALAAWSAWNAGEKDLASRWVKASIPPSFLTHNLRAEMALEAEEKEEAYRHWYRSLQFEPQQPHLIYRYWESRKLRSLLRTWTPNQVHIVLYTYNKLEKSLATLRSLLASGIGTCSVTLLNNGSTSFSKEDLALGVRAVAQGRPVNIVHLPVNIGAPAARNWLWHLPQVKSCDYVAFLDDDVLLPKGWLDLYMESLELFPNAVAVGPRGLNPGTLPTIQYVHRFFHQVGDHKILFTPAAPMFQDLGQFTYRHPCLSVMGCCHLFHRRRWEALGIPDFDICFSPSQVDDLEHDLQIWKKGGHVVYDGRVAVTHLQDAGRAAPQSRAAWGHVWGNHMKMESKFGGEDLEEIKRRVEDADDTFYDRVRNEVQKELFGLASTEQR